MVFYSSLSSHDSSCNRYNTDIIYVGSRVNKVSTESAPSSVTPMMWVLIVTAAVVIIVSTNNDMLFRLEHL